MPLNHPLTIISAIRLGCLLISPDHLETLYTHWTGVCNLLAYEHVHYTQKKVLMVCAIQYTHIHTYIYIIIYTCICVFMLQVLKTQHDMDYHNYWVLFGKVSLDYQQVDTFISTWF